jgi:Spy/CpxP family protein refolding chaperone
MAYWRSASTFFGFLAMAAALALLSPGVTAVRADDAVAASSSEGTSDGPTCQAGTLAGADEIRDTIGQLQQLEAKQRAASPPDASALGEVVVLNSRGYNDEPKRLELPSPRELSRER